MNCLDTYNYQITFYRDKEKAWNSLSKECQDYIKTNNPDKLPNKDRKKIKRRYITKCWKITNTNKHLLLDIHKRKFREYDIDHIVPIYYGFKNSIPEELIGSVENLQVIDHKRNTRKSVHITEQSSKLLNDWKLKYNLSIK